jgi:AMMECR1 domain-containing protein
MNVNIHACLAINGCYKFLNINKDTSTQHYLYSKYVHNKYTFGLFVTIERVVHKLTTFPHEVHGCLGYYDKYPFKPITKQLAYSKLISLGHDTATTDTRKSNFPELYLDYLANFKVSLMQLPLITINSKSGRLRNNSTASMTVNTSKRTMTTLNSNYTKKINSANSKPITNNKQKTNNKQNVFDNYKYGLLTVSNGNTATYLPGVFENTSWHDIKSSLLNKAGIATANTNNLVKFYAYNTLTSNCVLIDFFTYKVILALKYLEHIITISTLFKNDNTPVYEINTSIITNSPYVYDETDYVRNAGVCSDIIKAIHFIYTNLDTKFLSSYNNVLNDGLYKAMSYLLYVWNKYSAEYNISYLQAVSFVIVGLCYYLNITENIKTVSSNNTIHKLSITRKQIKQYVNDYCNVILENKIKLESDFEYGVCGVALFTASDKFKYYKPISLVDKRKSNKQYEFIVPDKFNIDSKSPSLDTLFKINWLIQLLVLIDNKYYLTVKIEAYITLFKTLVTALVNILDMYYLTDNANALSNLETNYIAVAYEACMNLYLSYSKFTILDTEIQNSIKKYIVILSVELVSRVDYTANTKSLYKFKSGTASLDITGHTIVC